MQDTMTRLDVAEAYEAYPAVSDQEVEAILRCFATPGDQPGTTGTSDLPPAGSGGAR